MNALATGFLEQLGYTVNQKALSTIQTCDEWYRNAESSMHRRQRVDGAEYELVQMGFAKRGCADDANLCEVIEINGGTGKAENDPQFEAVKDMLSDNAFDTMYRKQLELCAALGTVAAYWRVDGAQKYTDGTARGGVPRLNYIDGKGFVPLTVENGDVTEAAFVGESVSGGKKNTTMVLCTQDKGVYSYRTVMWDEKNAVISDTTATLGDVKPFAVMRVAAVNNIKDMDGYGLPKITQAIPVLAGLDSAFTALFGDIDDSEKLTLINELLCGFDDNGKPISPNEAMKRRFIYLGEKLPTQGALISEIVPKIRVSEFTGVIELLLSAFSLLFGYGTKKYSFQQGQIVTATQYIGERQDMMQELNRQRYEARQYIEGIVRAGLWFMNTFTGASWDVSVDVLVEFDDSFIEDKNTKLVEIRNDVLSGIGGRHVAALYLQEKYNLTEDEAMAWVLEAEVEEDGGEDGA